MEKLEISVQDEIRHMSNETDVRQFESLALKAAYILLNYAGEANITKESLGEFFKISTSEIPKATWKLLCGYTQLGWNQPRYMAPVNECALTEWVQNCRDE